MTLQTSTDLLLANRANLLVILRSALIFGVIFLFSRPSAPANLWGLGALAAAVILDGVDGHIARKYRESSNVGGLMDTLGDRITENLLLIYFASRNLVPVIVPLVFVARSFVSDFIRTLNYGRGGHTFSLHASKAGRLLVASPVSRAVYLAGKLFVFFLGGLIITGESLAAGGWQSGTLLAAGKTLLLYSALCLLAGNLFRFLFLVYDARRLLAHEFGRH